MDQMNDDASPQAETPAGSRHAARRAALKNLGRYAAVSAPAVTLLLAAVLKPRKAAAIS